MEHCTQPQAIRYKLLECIGQGLNSRVFRALREDIRAHIRQPVAIKILNSENLVEVWKKEFLSLSKVRSPYCVSVLGFDWIEKQPALVLELVEGYNLATLTQHVELTADEIKEIAAQVRQGLEDLSAAHLYHGDLSLNNIMINEEGRVLLLDFGLANASDSLVQTTVAFAAPEVLGGLKPNLQTDLYSLQKIIEHLCVNSSSVVIHDCVSQASSKNLLAEKVREFRQQIEQRMQTAQITSPRRRHFGVLRLALLFMLLTCGLSLRGEAWLDTRPSYLSVRTNHWLTITIDGQDIGYAPFEARPIVAGNIEIDYRHNRGAGHRTLTIHKGQHIVLGNSFFGL